MLVKSEDLSAYYGQTFYRQERQLLYSTNPHRSSLSKVVISSSDSLAESEYSSPELFSLPIDIFL